MTQEQMHQSSEIIQSLVQELKTAEITIAQKEEEIKQLKATKKELQEITIPDTMAELGASSIVLLTGEVVKVEPYYFARLPEEVDQTQKLRREKFFSWLRANNFGGLIKERVEAYPGEQAQLLIDFLNSCAIDHEISSTIHWRTLEAWYKECCEAGVKSLPLDLFQNYQGRKAKVK